MPLEERTASKFIVTRNKDTHNECEKCFDYRLEQR